MNNLERIIRKKALEHGKSETLTRIKVGRGIAFIAALPLFTSWMFIIAIPMMMPLKPSMWAKDKIRYFQESRRFR